MVRTLQFYQLAEGATQATQLIVGWFPNHFHDVNYILDKETVYKLARNSFRCNKSLFYMLPTLCFIYMLTTSECADKIVMQCVYSLVSWIDINKDKT